MNRAEQAEKTTKALYGGASALGVTDPEFAAIKERLIYGEVYAEEKLSARLRELVILVVATTNQTMNEVKRHTAAALACGVKPEEIKEAVYHCAPYIGLGKAENAVNAVNAVFAEKGIVLPLTSGQTAKLAKILAGVTGGDLFEIAPETAYTGAFAPCKHFAQQNLGGGEIHFHRAF